MVVVVAVVVAVAAVDNNVFVEYCVEQIEMSFQKTICIYGIIII